MQPHETLALSWEKLLRSAVQDPGILHAAYRRFWNYSLTNQMWALMQCQARGIQPGPLASFSRWKELGRSVKKGEKALALLMPVTVRSHTGRNTGTCRYEHGRRNPDH
ncbi:MAG: ArdC family protein [Bryobacteraceae bacterium]